MYVGSKNEKRNRIQGLLQLGAAGKRCFFNVERQERKHTHATLYPVDDFSANQFTMRLSRSGKLTGDWQS